MLVNTNSEGAQTCSFEKDSALPAAVAVAAVAVAAADVLSTAVRDEANVVEEADV